MTDPSSEPVTRPPLLQGRVVRKSRGYYFIQTGQGEVLCRISNRLRKALVFPTSAGTSTRQGVVGVRNLPVVDPVAVGDMVGYVDAGGGTGAIREVLPRRNKFSRMAQRGRPLEQIIAANIDQVLAVFAAARPDPRWDMLDRMVVEAEMLGVPIRIVITKMDMADDEEVEDISDLYEGLGYPVHHTCALSRAGIDGLIEALRGQVSVLVGESGVGKTTLLNTIQPGLGRRVGEVREDRHGRGRHTTTMLELVDLEMGGSLIDTPGINAMDLCNPDAQLEEPAMFYPEMRRYLGQCHFGRSCTHMHEPGCAILAAVESGAIDERRHMYYCEARETLLGASGKG